MFNPKQAWDTVNRALQVEDSLTVGSVTAGPLIIVIVLVSILEGFLARIWTGPLTYLGIRDYFVAPGSMTVLTLLALYAVGRMSKSEWFIRTVGRLIARLPLVGGWYKRAVWLIYTKRGFLKPVWVFRYGTVECAAGNAEKVLLGGRRRGFFLREVEDSNPDLPPLFRRMIEVLIIPSQLVGGEPELFPFPLVAVQVKPGISEFTEATVTQGLSGYPVMETLNWDKARELIKFAPLPEKDCKLLEGLGIIVPKQLGQFVKPD